MIITSVKMDDLLGFKKGYTSLMIKKGWRNAHGYKMDNKIWVMDEYDAIAFASNYGDEKLEKVTKYLKERKEKEESYK